MKFKEAIRTNNPTTLKMANELKKEWLTKCSQARLPQYMS